jgi:hypothetical protein
LIQPISAQHIKAADNHYSLSNSPTIALYYPGKLPSVNYFCIKMTFQTDGMLTWAADIVNQNLYVKSDPCQIKVELFR